MNDDEEELPPYDPEPKLCAAFDEAAHAILWWRDNASVEQISIESGRSPNGYSFGGCTTAHRPPELTWEQEVENCASGHQGARCFHPRCRDICRCFPSQDTDLSKGKELISKNTDITDDDELERIYGDFAVKARNYLTDNIDALKAVADHLHKSKILECDSLQYAKNLFEQLRRN